MDLAMIFAVADALSYMADAGRLMLQSPGGFDMSIESMQSKQFSVGIFWFLILGILVFTGIVAMFLFQRNAQALKTGEKWLFAWLLLGIVVAVAFGATQLLYGFLF